MAERMACLVNCLPQPRPLHTLADDAIDVPWIQPGPSAVTFKVSGRGNLSTLTTRSAN